MFSPKHSERRQTMSKLVTFEQKQSLRRLGYNFDDICFCGGAMDCICEHLPDEAKLITVSDALDWIREEKEIVCFVEYEYRLYQGVIYNDKDKSKHILKGYTTHPLASSALLTAVLTYLEQNTTAL